MAFTTDSIAGYISGMELATLNYLFGTETPHTGDATLPPIYGIAGGNCLWGRYARLADPDTLPTASAPKYQDPSSVSQTPKLYEGYSCSGYGSPQALHGMVKRHNHHQGKAFLARYAKHWVDMTHWNIDNHDMPPGEYNKHEPHAPRNNRKTNIHFPTGDSDIHRHHDAFGHFKVLCDPEFKALGGWDTSDVLNIASVLENYYKKSFQGIAGSGVGKNQHTREYHRLGNRLNSLAGVYDAYKTYNKPEDATRILQLSASLVNLYYQEGWSLAYAGNLATSTFTIWNYGDFLDGDCKTPAFLYTHYRYGSQPWYDGHQLIGLYNLGLRFLAASYSTATTITDTTSIVNIDDYMSEVEGEFSVNFDDVAETDLVASANIYDVAYQRCVEVIDKTTKWYDPVDRVHAPLGDYTSAGSQDMVNCKLQGMKTSDIDIQYLGSTCTNDALTAADWNALDDGEDYYRWWVTDIHESDGKYHHVFETDDNGVEFRRIHYPYNHYRFDKTGDPVARYDTGGEAYHVRPEVTNAYLTPDMVWMRGLVHGSNEIKDFARILMFDYWAHSHHPSTRKINKDDRFTGEGWTEDSYHAMKFNNWWHWCMQSGHLIRDADLGTG